jgi:hypothetical protein
MGKHIRRVSDRGKHGPAMRGLPKQSWRVFVYNYATAASYRGPLVDAYRAAGFSKKSTPANVVKAA